MMVTLQLSDISFSYRNGLVLHNIDLVVNNGEMVGLIGPNGSGKTTLIKLISGLLRPGQGDIRVDNCNLERLNRRTIARSLAVVPQQFHTPYAFTVAEIVSLGRIPFLRGFAGMRPSDQQAITQAARLAGVENLAERRFDELSGGEQQKVILAMALAQNPRLLLLDEPTVHLDINHQIEILDLVRELNREEGITVIAALHDLNLAALYCRRLVMLHDGRIAADGTPAEVLTAERIHTVFAARVRVTSPDGTGIPHIMVMPGEGKPAGDESGLNRTIGSQNKKTDSKTRLID